MAVFETLNLFVEQTAEQKFYKAMRIALLSRLIYWLYNVFDDILFFGWAIQTFVQSFRPMDAVN